MRMTLLLAPLMAIQTTVLPAMATATTAPESMLTPTELSGAAAGSQSPSSEVPPVIAEGLAMRSAEQLENSSAVRADEARVRAREVEIFLDSARVFPRLEAAK